MVAVRRRSGLAPDHGALPLVLTRFPPFTGSVLSSTESSAGSVRDGDNSRVLQLPIKGDRIVSLGHTLQSTDYFNVVLPLHLGANDRRSDKEILILAGQRLSVKRCLQTPQRLSAGCFAIRATGLTSGGPSYWR